MKNLQERFPFLSKHYQLTKEIYRNKTLIYLGQDVVQLFLAHTFYIDTIADPEWNKMYYEPKEYENLVSYFYSPIFNGFVMMENFYESKVDVFKIFRIEDDKTRDYINLCLAMFEKDNNKKNAEQPLPQESKAKP